MIPSYFANLVSKGAEICRGCYYSTLDFTLKDLLSRNDHLKIHNLSLWICN